MKLSTFLDADWHALMQRAGGPVRERRLSDGLSPRFAPVVILRAAGVAHARGHGRLAKLLSLMNFLLFGIEVPPRALIGPGLVIAHTQGTVLGAARIGANVVIFQQVTLGAAEADFDYDVSTRPVVGDGVMLSAGAKVLGPVHLGDGCVVGANAVVVDDVPAGYLAVGVPARALPRGRRPEGAA